VTHLEPEFFQEYGSQRVQIKYGPFTVPGFTVDNGMRNFGLDDAQLPCHGCLITWMQADLEFADGSSANAATGMWLHHTVFMNLGRPAVKSCGSGRERFFASGNERTVMDCTHEGCAPEIPRTRMPRNTDAETGARRAATGSNKPTKSPCRPSS
jgi:hypothetical protein